MLDTEQNENEAACGGSALTAVLGADYVKEKQKFLGFMVITGLDAPSDTIEFWQDGKRIGRIIGLGPNGNA
jgi:hypothetical protein